MLYDSKAISTLLQPINDPKTILDQLPEWFSSYDEDGLNLLHWAIILERNDLVDALLKQPAISNIINLSNHLGLTPVHLSILNHDSAITRKLCYAGADASILDTNTPFGNAMQNRNIVTLRQLNDNEAYNKQLNQLSYHKKKKSLVHLLIYTLVQQTDIDTLQHIVDQLPDDDEWSRNNILFWATVQGKKDIFKWGIEHKLFEVSNLFYSPHYLWSEFHDDEPPPLYLAAIYRHTAFIQWLVDEKYLEASDFTEIAYQPRGTSDYSILAFVLSNHRHKYELEFEVGNLDLPKWLVTQKYCTILAENDDPEGADNTPFMAAIEAGNRLDFIDCLLNEGLLTRAEIERQKVTAITSSPSIQSIEWFINKGFFNKEDIRNIIRDDYETFLNIVIWRGDIQLTQWLFSQGYCIPDDIKIHIDNSVGNGLLTAIGQPTFDNTNLKWLIGLLSAEKDYSFIFTRTIYSNETILDEAIHLGDQERITLVECFIRLAAENHQSVKLEDALTWIKQVNQTFPTVISESQVLLEEIKIYIRFGDYETAYQLANRMIDNTKLAITDRDQAKLFIVEIFFNGFIGIKNTIFASDVPTQDVPACDLPCDLILMQDIPDSSRIDLLPLTIDKAYIRVRNQIYYVDRKTSQEQCCKLQWTSDTLQWFDTAFGVSDLNFNVPKRLTEEGLQLLQKIKRTILLARIIPAYRFLIDNSLPQAQQFKAIFDTILAGGNDSLEKELTDKKWDTETVEKFTDYHVSLPDQECPASLLYLMIKKQSQILKEKAQPAINQFKRARADQVIKKTNYPFFARLRNDIDRDLRIKKVKINSLRN